MEKVRRWSLGTSAEGREISVHANFPAASPAAQATSTLLIGGTHGDEHATVPLLETFIAAFLEAGRVRAPVAVIPLLNPDGFARGTRHNARGVDLNRNFPYRWSADADEPPGAHPLSEPEALLLHDFILAHRPAKIISLHWALAEIDADGPQSAPLARAMWEALPEMDRRPYRLRLPGAGGTPCSGSLGQWCGHALAHPGETGSAWRPAMITLELPYHGLGDPRPPELPADHLETVRSWWESRPRDYLSGTEPAVHRLLEAACLWRHDVSGKPA